MASHVVVIDASARRATVKCNPGTHMSDVLVEACQKLKLKQDQYVLRHNKKLLDLSRTFRLSGLPSGAQLELVQGSRSPQVVNVALQLPASDNNTRVTEKFASTTSLWQILRRFESGVAGSVPSLNLTQRATPQTQNATGGSGRLFYDMPVIQVMGRELGSFVDLQKTLAQLGITGSALLRLSYKNSGLPLEEAMMEISQYFKESEEQAASMGTAAGAHAASAGEVASLPQVDSTGVEGAIAGEEIPPDTKPTEVAVPGSLLSSQPPPSDQTPAAPTSPPTSSSQEVPPVASQDPSTNSRNIRVFHAPSSNTPLAASQSYNETDYIPSIAHAQAHQSRLNTEARNRRLASDRELASQQQERQERLANVTTVRVRVRFPDSESLELDFGQEDTSADVYSQVRQLMRNPDAPFILIGAVGKSQPFGTLPSTDVKVISGLGWRGGLQIHMRWEDGAPTGLTQPPVLAEQWRKQRTHLDRPAEFQDEVEEKATANAGSSKGKQRAEGGGGSVEEKMKKFLRFGKK